MNSNYRDLTDEDKILESIKFVAIGHPLPAVYEDFLRTAGLYDAIVYPQGGASGSNDAADP